MLYLFIALALQLQAETGAVVRLYPIDDTARDPAFRSYIAKLRNAVDTRDAAALRRLVASDVVVGPSREDEGWAKFIEKWRPDAGTDSELWPALSDLLSLGFVREHPRLFVSPYLVWRFPPDLDMTTHLVVVRDNVQLRTSPSLRAPPAASLSFDIVKRLGEPEDKDNLMQWVYVQTLDGQRGYLNTRDAMSPLMPRAQFGLRRGRWTMIALEAPER